MGKLVVADYGIGNVFSVCNALKAAGGDPVLTGDPIAIRSADRLVLPGVGAFAKAREALDRLHFAEHLEAFVATGRPFLGVCVGMQLLLDESTEFGLTPGLGYFRGRVQRIDDTAPDGTKLRVPHIGWATLSKPGGNPRSWQGTLIADLEETPGAVYFVHSFHGACTNPGDVLAVARYGGNEITAAVQRDNIVGVQFHPERSGRVGQAILKRFLSS